MNEARIGALPALEATPGVKVLKLVHVISLVAFLGSILGHIATSALVGGNSDGNVILVSRQITRGTTLFLTVPGMWLLVLSGIALAWQRPDLRRTRWLRAKQVLSLFVVVLATLVIVPTGAALLELAEKVAAGTASAEAYFGAERFEQVAGAINVMMVLAATALAVAKPKLARRNRRPSHNGGNNAG